MKQAKSRLTGGALAIVLTTATVLAIVALPGTAPGQQAEEEVRPKAVQAAVGRVTFRIYCANCHGDKGLGDGKLAEILTVQPTNLTTLSAENGGEFPGERIREVIDGRTEKKGHGTREMPIWGDAFQKTLRRTWKEVTDEERAQMKIDEVVAFLETIQLPAD